MSDRTILFDLKEKAKWSHDPEERKAAIKELSAKGQNALPQLEEIFTITAYEDIKAACAEAIREIRNITDDSGENLTVSESNSATTPAMMAAKNQKKEQTEGESETNSEIRLADLPP